MTTAVEVFGSPQPQTKRQTPSPTDQGVWRFSFCDRAGIMVREDECWLTLQKPWIWQCDFCGAINDCG